MNPVITLGFINIHIYSIFILVAVIIGYLLIVKESSKWGLSKDFVFNLFFWTIIFGIIGARLFYVLFNFDYYSNNLLEILQVWKGGLAIYGGIIAGVITMILYCRKYEADILRVFDIFVVSLILGQAIGRWGNFFNSEAHGPVVSIDLLHKLFIPNFVINGMNIDGSYYLPTFYFESIACLIGFIILFVFRRMKRTKIGQTFSLYMIIYGLIRFVIESFRTDSLMFLDFKIAQIISIVMIILGIVLFTFFKKRGTRFENLYNDDKNIREVDF